MIFQDHNTQTESEIVDLKELISTARMLDKTTNEIISKQDVVNERKSFSSILKMAGVDSEITGRFKVAGEHKQAG